MKVCWGRVLFVVVAFMIIAVYLWLRQNSYEVRYRWSSFVRRLTDFSGSDILQICFYIALSLGIAMLFLWLLSRVIEWFRR